MDVPQKFPNPSSQHRMTRFEDMNNLDPIQAPDEMLNVLGDTNDRWYPIYRNGDLSGGYTVSSVLFDLGMCKMMVFEENPKTHKPTFEIDICN